MSRVVDIAPKSLHFAIAEVIQRHNNARAT